MAITLYEKITKLSTSDRVHGKYQKSEDQIVDTWIDKPNFSVMSMEFIFNLNLTKYQMSIHSDYLISAIAEINGAVEQYSTMSVDNA